MSLFPTSAFRIPTFPKNMLSAPDNLLSYSRKHFLTSKLYFCSNFNYNGMKTFIRPLQIRWSDMDPNFHVRHSIYYDFGAQLRTEFLFSHGLTPQVMMKHQVGPVLFREEALFKRELRYGDDLQMNLKAYRLKRDGSRFAMRHEILRGEEICAVLSVEGAWIDTQKRKLTAPPEIARQVLDELPRTDDFEWLE